MPVLHKRVFVKKIMKLTKEKKSKNQKLPKPNMNMVGILNRNKISFVIIQKVIKMKNVI